MASHVYFFDRAHVPDWNSAEPSPTDPASVGRRRQLADAIAGRIPGMIEPADCVDARERWIVLFTSGLDVTVCEDHVHVRIRYWSEAELNRLGVPGHLRRIAEVVRSEAGYDFVEHGDFGLGLETIVDSIVPRVAEHGDRLTAAIHAQLGPTVGAPLRGAELAW